ncbi:MAG: hypothetical protein LDL23_11425 [Flavobacterium sp.]|uniref:hypothetical protein n=1 Tax=Flavobacterium sp. TaxID=239 RepID=UPI0025C037A9|nr:hypothetical protein [Flavobacterium sp.]MCA1967245.1 hypothetical protein [Flavobacterium sp.]
MNSITNFWNYFQQNNFVFLFLNEVSQEEIKQHFYNLKEVLNLYNKDLDLIIKNKKIDAELIITAHGNPYLFKEVELLVLYAPKIKRWKITAFIQPETDLTKYENGTDKPFKFYGINLKVSDINFVLLGDPDKPLAFGIRVFLKNYIIYKENPKLKEAVYILIEHLIGEKSFANDLKFIDINQLNQIDENHLKLHHLKLYLDNDD